MNNDITSSLLKIAEDLESVADALEKDASSNTPTRTLTTRDDNGYGTVSTKLASGGYDSLTEFCLS